MISYEQKSNRIRRSGQAVCAWHIRHWNTEPRPQQMVGTHPWQGRPISESG